MGSPKFPNFPLKNGVPLTGQQLRVARLHAEGWINKRQLCKRCKIDRKTLFNWLQNKAFAAQVDEFRAVYKKRIRTEGIASLENRVRTLNQLQAKFRRVIRERGRDPSMKNVPGGRTGLLARQQKMLGSGPLAVIVEEYEVDTALTKELRETLLQAAKELGQLEKAGEDETPDRVIRTRPLVGGSVRSNNDVRHDPPADD